MTPPAVPLRPRGRVASTRAQAKVNLILRVLAREDNGYHQIETLFCRLDLADGITVRVDARGRELNVRGAVPAGGLGPVERNLAWRAAEAFLARAGWPNDWVIEIDKRIPVGGGLGGGSADAGAVLRCLNALAPTPLDTSALLEVAGTLGADVPFLTLESPLALGWGRGDRLLPLTALPSREVALACFPFGVSTPDAYRWIDEATAGPPAGAALDLSGLALWSDIATLAHNDFEPVVAARYPVIASTLSAWRSSASSTEPALTLLAGSGATVFHVASRLMGGMSDALDPSITVVRTRTADRVVGIDVAD